MNYTDDLSHLPPVGQACAILSRWTGLELKGSAPRRVEEFLNRRAAQLGYATKQEYVDDLQRLVSTDPEPQRLINLVTNGLTAFWRDLPQLDALETVFDKLGDSRSPQRPINVWCAGCSTGEEAYTVAMIAAEYDVPIHVLGSDLNTESLRHARRGVYGEWSLRRTEPERRARFFREIDEGRYEIDPAIAERVAFAHHNIVEASPNTPSGDSWDVIMCRNVLIYFSAEAMRRVMGNFSTALHTDGYLLLGSSEQLHTGQIPSKLVPFRSARQGGGFVYRLRSTPPGQTVVFPPRPPEPDPDPEITPPHIEMPGHGLDEVTTDITTDVTGYEAATNLLEMAAEHLEHGRTEAALACCEATACYDPFVPENYCLMAYVLADEGGRAQALDTYRKALFLDPFNWLVALESGRLHLRDKDITKARRAFRQAIEGIAEQPELSKGMQRVAEAMYGSIPQASAAQAYCLQQLDRLAG